MYRQDSGRSNDCSPYYYQMPKDKALAALYQFSETSGASFPEAAKTILKIPNLGSARPGFVDRLIHRAGHARNHKLVTFEKAAQNCPIQRC